MRYYWTPFKKSPRCDIFKNNIQLILFKTDFIKKRKNAFIFLKCESSTILIRNGENSLHFRSKNILIVWIFKQGISKVTYQWSKDAKPSIVHITLIFTFGVYFSYVCIGYLWRSIFYNARQTWSWRISTSTCKLHHEISYC